MDPSLPQLNPMPSGTNAERCFKKAILRLVKNGPERLAIEAGQIDGIIDPASGHVILLPEAQRALIERKAGFRGLIGLAFDWYWEQDERYCFISHRGATAVTLGFEEAEIIGKALWDLPIDNMSDTDWQTHRQQLEWRIAFRDLEIRHKNNAGEVRYFSISGEPIFDDRDQFKGYRGITRDISERKEADALMQESNRFSHAVLNALGTAVGVLDQTGTVLSANEAWHALTTNHSGIGAGAAEGCNYLAVCEDACPSERLDGITLAAGIRQVIAGERAHFHYEYACVSPGGQCWFELSVTGVAGNSAVRAIVSSRDITERKRGELLLSLERTVLYRLADADEAKGALKSVIRAVCEAQGWDYGRYICLDHSAGVLRVTESWGMAVAAVEQLLEKSRGMVFRQDAGLAGRVCRSGQPFWVPGSRRDAGASSAALAPDTGEDGAFLFPVTSEDQIVGVLAFSGHRVCEPDDRMLQAVKSIGGQLGRFLQRQGVVEALRRSERRLRVLNNLTTDWCWEQDKDFRFTEVVGCSPFGTAEILGMTYWDLPYVDLTDEGWAILKSQVAARWSFSDFEFAADRPAGNRGYYSISGEPMYDECGVFAGYCGTGLDITLRKRAEISLRESESHWRALADPSPG